MSIDNRTPCPDDLLIFSYRNSNPSTPFPPTFWIEADCRVGASSNLQPDKGACALYIRQNNVCGWVLEMDNDEIFLNWDGQRMATFSMPAQFGARFRLVTHNSTNEADVYVNGQLVLSGIAPGPNCITPGIFDTQAGFGNFHADEPALSVWTDVRHNLTLGDGILCEAFMQPNSSGATAGMSSSGSRSVATNDFTLHADGLPPVGFGIFIVSRFGHATPLPNTSGLPLCLGGSIGRFVGPGQVLQASPAGDVQLTVDLTQFPQLSTFVAVAPGETWAFQYWFRDTAHPAWNFSNVSHGLEVEFE